MIASIRNVPIRASLAGCEFSRTRVFNEIVFADETNERRKGDGGGVRELKKKEEGKQRLERARIVAFLFVPVKCDPIFRIHRSEDRLFLLSSAIFTSSSRLLPS